MSLSDLQDGWRQSTIVYAHNLPHNNAGTRHCMTVKLQIILTVLAILFGFIVQLLLKEGNYCKLYWPWQGPCELVKVIADVLYQIWLVEQSWCCIVVHY